MKTRMDLYNMAIRAWKEGWWYIRGGYINIGTDRFINGKIEQYTYNATYERHIRNYIEVTRRMGKTPILSDCYGLVKGTAWYDPAK